MSAVAVVLLFLVYFNTAKAVFGLIMGQPNLVAALIPVLTYPFGVYVCNRLCKERGV